MSNQLRIGSSIYINYILLGMINLIIALHMGFLTEQLNTDAAAISALISAIGIGKLIALSFAGKLSDNLGRRPMLITACFLYVVFLVAIPFAPTYTVAFMFALLAGMGNSILDTSSYPALIEVFRKRSSSATVLVKAFMSVGSTILPLMITFFMARDMFYGYTFFIMAGIFLINALHLMTLKFPEANVLEEEPKEETKQDKKPVKKLIFKEKPKFLREGITVIAIGFTSVGLFLIIQTWLATYAEEVVGLPEAQAINLLSVYSFGGFATVIILATLLDRLFRPITALIIYPLIAITALTTLLFVESYTILIIIAFILGMATSGLFQLAVTLMAQFFPEKKGTSTAFVTLSSSIGFITLPYVTGLINRHIGVSYVFMFEIIIAVIAVVLAAFISYRYRKVFDLEIRKPVMWRNP
ncbi:MFS transporter [Jeotgalicoccus halotolerans]|uniref:MFS transporter n=1 Tax=Jeotgalicoccus halotolerans TaxID=157227 RepID=UPI003519316F